MARPYDRQKNDDHRSPLQPPGAGMVSVIIPTYNEADSIAATLGTLGRARGGFEVIVADGSSPDGTRLLVEAVIAGFPRPLRVITTARHRALQLNSAASVASGDAFLFLHADVTVPAAAIEALEEALRDASLIGGNFQIVFEGASAVERFFTWAYRVRRPFGIYYGDSGIFVRRLERTGRTACLEPALTVSGRRWRVQGLLPTLASWVWIQTLYSLRVPPQHLARWYGPVRNGKPSQ